MQGEPGAGLRPIPCPQLGFTTMADASYPWKYKEGDGITIYTKFEDSIPYVLVWQSEDLIAEPLAYIKENFTPYILKKYGSDLVSFTAYEFYDIGGKRLPAGLYTYRLQGHLIEMLRLYDSTGARTVAYTAKYVQGEGDKTLAALDTAIRHFRAEPARRGAENGQGPDRRAAGPAKSARGFALTPIMWDRVGLGKVAVPRGYKLDTQVHCSDQTTCLGAPVRVDVTLTSMEDAAVLKFYASEIYVERLRSILYRHVEGRLDGQLMIFMRRYQDAAAYCDAVAKSIRPSAVFHQEEDLSSQRQNLQRAKAQWAASLKGYPAPVRWSDVTVAQRVYTYPHDGVPWALCIAAGVRGFEYGMFGEQCRMWEVPARYMMTCPLKNYRQLHDEIFMPFVENTAVSDQFVRLNTDLTNQVTSQAIRASNMITAQSLAYARSMSALQSSSVDAYLRASSYSSTDRFTDYIFDQNSYTTSDGRDVKVSTRYDYVWEGDNGTVYYSDSAFDMPSGATQLHPK